MKKLILSLIIALFASTAWAAGTCTVATPTRAVLHGAGTSTIMISVACTADAADGSFPDTTISNVGGIILNVYADPGATAPTTAMDMTLELGTTGIDLLGGAGANIATAADALITPANTAGDNYIPGFAGDLTLKQSGNSVNSAGITYYIVLQP